MKRAMTIGTSNAPSDTFKCRQYHLGLARSSPTNSVIHCPHASPGGGDVCVSHFCATYQTTCVDTNKGVAYANCASDITSMAPGLRGEQ